MRQQDQRCKMKNMKKIKLNDFTSFPILNDSYILNPKEKYVISIKKELDYQSAIFNSFIIMGAPPALKNYHAWLYENGFDVNSPNPTNEFVSSFYGEKPLWQTPYSMGIVVKVEEDDDYYIVMECSDKNRGFKHTQIILTLGGCL